MHLREFTQTLQRIPFDVRSRVRLKEYPILLKPKAEELAATYSGITIQPAHDDVVQAIYRILTTLQQGREPQTKDWKKAAWSLWMVNPSPLQHSVFTARYQRWLHHEAGRSAIRILISAYLQNFSENLDISAVVGRWLGKIITNWTWVWSERQEKYKLFEASEAPEHVAKAACADKLSIYEFLDSIDVLKSTLGLSGFGITVMKKILSLLQDNLSTAYPDHNFLEQCMALADDVAILGCVRSSLAESLLLPWLEHSVQADIQDKIQSFLLLHYQDPRLNKENWKCVDQRAEAVMRRWLTRASLEQFIQVVDATTKAEQWPYRRAFWMSYFKAGHISDANVAFARVGRDYAKTAFKDSYFGFIERGCYQPDQAVLLLKIGGLTIADWSHNGSCRIYLSSNNNTPSLDKPIYEGSELRASCNNGDGDGTAHHSSDTGLWQSRVADFIKEHTGITMPKHQYMDIRA